MLCFWLEVYDRIQNFVKNDKQEPATSHYQTLSYLRNEFNYGMFMETWMLHDSMNIPKIEFIAYIYILL